MPKKIDRVGQRFGKLIVLEFSHRVNGNALWKCRCDCGNEKSILGDSLRDKKALSCGCLGRAQFKERVTTHGMGRTKIYRVWKGMRERCNNPKHKSFHNYGGRGIKVCKRWHKFENFYLDMGDRPSVNHSIDRINNNKDYCKSNCRWTTQSEQVNNTRRSVLLTYNGKTQSMKDWSRELKIKYHRISDRYQRNLPVERILSTEILQRKGRKGF